MPRIREISGRRALAIGVLAILLGLGGHAFAGEPSARARVYYNYGFYLNEMGYGQELCTDEHQAAACMIPSTNVRPAMSAAIRAG